GASVAQSEPARLPPRRLMDKVSPLPLGEAARSAGEGGVRPSNVVADMAPSPQPSPRGRGSFAWLVAVLGAALLIAELPAVLAMCCAPAGATGLGTAWFVNDFAQYESAMRQGAEQSGWLVHDPFTAEPHQAAFMFPLYVGVGKLAATLRVSAMAVEHGLEVMARVVLVLALWRFCRAFARDAVASRWAFGMALFASGFELFAALAGGYSGNWS